MTLTSLPQAVPRPSRRRWPWVIVAGMAGSFVLLWLTAPRLTCWVMQRQTPLVTDAVVVRGVQFSATPANAAMVVGRCSPAVLKQIVEGASGRWLPGMLLGHGQHAWGTFIDAPEVTWRLDVDTSASVPEITAGIPQPVAERVVARYLTSQHSLVSQVKLREVSLIGEPSSATQMAWQAHLCGTAQLYLWEQSLAIEVEQAVMTASTTLTKQATGDYRLDASLRLVELRGTTPLGPVAPLLPTLEQQLNQGLKQLTKVVIPGWWPLVTRWNLRVLVGEGLREF